MGLKLNTASSGSVTLEPANTASNYTLTVPAQTGTVVATDSSGNVGIGTSSPSTKFQVVGGVASTGGDVATSGAAITMYYDTSNDYGVTSTLHNGVSWKPYVIRSNGMIFKTTGDVEAARLDSSGNFKFNSGYGSAATAYGCRAWVNFNGTGTVAIRSSGNVSSITDNGVGDYTVNFTNAMPDVNYSVNYSIGAYTPTETYDRFGWITAASNSTSSCRVRVKSNSNTSYDEVYNNVAIFR